MTDAYYREIDFKGGIEIHQQINTRKLFCECSSKIRRDRPAAVTKRKLHAVASEMGEYDPAALHEAVRNRTFHYQSYLDSVCLVELDEEPPHPVNPDALEVVLQAGLLLDARIVDEIQVMRKTVIDGSNTAGFQRTMLAATDGRMQTEEGAVALQYFCLEEDAARIIETNGRDVVFRLDRLGIPLLEIVTGPVCVSPRQAGEVADRLGHIIRSLNVRRGIGTIRQDVNVSTKFGTRIEIKGVQKHRMIPAIMEYEAQRQASLHAIAQELRRIVPEVPAAALASQARQVTDIFRRTGSRILRSVIDAGGSVAGLRIPAFAGFLGRELCPSTRLGAELKDQLLTLGIDGLLHSDEALEKYGLSGAELHALRKELNTADNDAFLLFAAKKDIVHTALEKLCARIAACFDGVPKESRRSLGDGTSQYMRPLPGEARMYPETDIPPVIITGRHLEETRRNLPEILEETLERLSAAYSLPVYDLWKIERSIQSFIFGVESLELNPKRVFAIIAGNVVDARRKTGAEFDTETLNRLLVEVKKGTILKEAVPAALERLAGGEALAGIVKSFASQTENIESVIRDTIERNREILSHPKRHAILMGVLMKELRGKIDGKTVADALTKALSREPVKAACNRE